EKFVASYDTITHTGATQYIYEQQLSDKFWDMSKSVRYPARKLNIKISGFISGVNTQKSLGVRLGTTADDSAASFTIPAEYEGSVSADISFVFSEPGKQVVGGTLNISGFSPLVSSRVTTVTMSGDKQVRLYASTASADDV